jgi:hypothetical protein
MNELELLDDYVPVDDWDDVLRRARRRAPRRRLVLAAVLVVAALAAAPAVAVHLLSAPPPRLPDAADRSHGVFAVLQPRSGRILIQAAPWKGHAGVCYLVVGELAGCAPRHTSATTFSYATKYPFLKGHPRVLAFWGYTFDRRVVSAKAFFPDGTARDVPVHRLGGRLDITFLGPVPMPLRRAPQSIGLFDARGNQLH